MEQQTFESVNAHIEKHSNKGTHLTANKLNVKDAYSIARPILVLLSQTFFVPAKWRTCITALVAGLDVEYPQG